MSENHVKKTNLVPAVCTQCGAALEVDPEQQAAVCPFCGTPFIVEKAINNYNITHVHQNNTVHIQQGKKGVIQSITDLADRQLEREQNARIRAAELDLEKQKLEMAREEKRKEARSSFWKKVLWFFGWIYCFPIPATILISRKNSIEKQKKIIYIAAAWAAYALFFLFVAISGGSDKKETAAQPQTVQPDSPDETKTDPWQEKTKQSDDYDTLEHTAVTVGDYVIDVPAWQTSDHAVFNIADSSGKTSGAFGIAQTDPISYDDTKLVNNLSKDLNSFMTADSFLDSEEVLSESVKINGIVMNHGIFHTSVKTSGSSIPAIVRIVWFVNPSDGSVIILQLREADGAPEGYKDDFTKIVQSIRQAETPPEPETSGNGMTFEEFKAYMDSYEQFFDSYCEFMKTYDSNDAAALTQYMNILSQYTDAMNALDAIDESQLTPEQDAYYTEVMLRISQKLLEAAAAQ